MIYISLFYEFFKIGIFSFGGGLAMLPLIHDVVLNNRWLTEQQFLDVIAISQVTPGPIAINAATFVGEQVAGIGGALFATLGCSLPSFIVILIIANIFSKLKNNKNKNYFFIGVKPVTLALISFAGIIIAKPTFFSDVLKNNLISLIIFVTVFFITHFTKLNSILILLIISGLGAFFY
nr:chromate transporter [uncultured Cetobacterium sp.]